MTAQGEALAKARAEGKTGTRYECRVCDQTFYGLKNFDAHLRDKARTNRQVCGNVK